ncbi:MAG: hypothetical protein J2P17_10305 [Mycobacterium sp.]|nr:hypothetical protein [Mycobacterium sp.]
MPPRSWNQRLSTACDTPTATAASSLVSPLATTPRNNPSTSRRSGGFPGDFIGALPVNSRIHPAGLPINTSTIKALRRPDESGLRATVGVNNAAGDVVDLDLAAGDGVLGCGDRESGLTPPVGEPAAERLSGFRCWTSRGQPSLALSRGRSSGILSHIRGSCPDFGQIRKAIQVLMR